MEKEEKEVKEVKEPKKRKKKKESSNKVLTTILIVLLLLSFLGIGFAVGSTQLFKEYKKAKGVSTIENGTLDEGFQNISIIDERVKEVVKDFQQIGFTPEDSYESDITQIDKKGLIITALKGLAYEQINYCKMYEKDLTIPISLEDLNKSLKKVIPDGKISLEDLKNNANKTTSYSIGGYGYTFKYYNGTKEEYSIKIIDDKLYVIGPCGHEGPNETIIESKTEKAELNGDALYVYQKVAFGKTEFEESQDAFIYYYYKDKDYKTNVEQKMSTEEPTWNQYNTYKLTFKKNGNKYYFESSKIE